MSKRTATNVDTSVNIPAAVKAAAEKASAIHAAAYEIPAEPTLPEVVEPPAPPEAPLVPVAEPLAQVTPQGNDWEHKYNSMKGRHDRLATANEQLNERVVSMEHTLAAMAAATPTPEPALTPTSLMTDEDVQQWGPEMLDMIERKAREKFDPIVNGLKSQIEELKTNLQNVGGVMQQDARSRMLDDLTKALPNWKEVNKNEKFMNWLVLPDTYSGAIRDELLQRAYAANDTPRVLAFFNGFLAEEAALAPPLPTPDPVLTPAVNKVPLETLAAPGRAKTAATLDVPAEKPSFTRAQVSQFYTDVAQGKYRGRDEDKNTLERQISEAGNAGRIR